MHFSSRGRTTCRAGTSSTSWPGILRSRWWPMCASFLAQIRARRRWSLHAGFALAPDTNIGGTSEERFIDIGGLPFRRDAEELTTSGIGVSAWTGGEYQLPAKSTGFDCAAAATFGDATTPAASSIEWLLSGHVGPRWFVGANSEISVLATVQRKLVWERAGPSTPLAGGSRLAADSPDGSTGFVQASWQDRQHRTRTYLDGPVADVSLNGSWVVTPTMRANAGLGWGRERPDLERWRHERQWLRAGIEVALPRGYTLGASGELRVDRLRGQLVSRTREAASPAKTARGASASPCTTGPCPGTASARSCRWYTRSGTPTRSCTTTREPAASCESCGCSEACRTSRAACLGAERRPSVIRPRTGLLAGWAIEPASGAWSTYGREPSNSRLSVAAVTGLQHRTQPPHVPLNGLHRSSFAVESAAS